jgi:hypothetical protein
MPSPDPDDRLQFDTVEPLNAEPLASPPLGAPGGPVFQSQLCAQCGQPIQSAYFAIRNHVICPTCANALGGRPPGFSLVAFFIASVMGLGAGLLGAIIWYGTRRIFHAEIGLIAVAVGFMVGKAVRKGSGGRGGPAYQVMAVAVTYCCIAANYMPDVLYALQSGTQHPGLPTMNELLFALWYCLKLPFLGGMENAIGLLIIGFALWEAWKFTKYRRLPMTGPYQMGPNLAVSSAPVPSSPGVII